VTTLFDPVRLGELALPHRVVMAPLTRNRAPGGIPVPLTAQYYAQRADPERGAALLITGASQIDPLGQGDLDTPGIHSDAQVAAWRQVTQAVHARGGRIAIQLWHVGRISPVSLLPPGEVPVAPSAIAAASKTFTRDGFVPCSVPRALAAEEIPAIVAQYRRAAERALDAGFDAVEVHGANGYLIDQFLRDSTNRRDDDWGGSIAHRCRFLVEVMQAVAEAGSAWMANNGYTREMALTAVTAGAADLVAFGRAFIANPDLTHRLRHGLPLALPDRKTFYVGGAAGYTDYPEYADTPDRVDHASRADRPGASALA
jgi:N-ethylmaleimide reductase